MNSDSKHQVNVILFFNRKWRHIFLPCSALIESFSQSRKADFSFHTFCYRIDDDTTTRLQVNLQRHTSKKVIT